jgi:hypothetical protein
MGKVLSALSLLLVISACDGGSKPGDGGSKPGGSDAGISLSDFPAALVDGICAYAVRCGQMPDLATCKAAFRADEGQVSADVQAGRTKYDGTAAAACLDTLGSRSCSRAQGSWSESQVCKDFVQGTVADDGACYVGSECVSGSCSGDICSGSECCLGACNPSPTAIPMGGDCSGSSKGCGSSAFCYYGSTPTCTAKGAAGQSCERVSYARSCVDGMYCVPNGTDTGICGALPARGEICRPVGVCDSLLDYCDSVTSTCVPNIPVGGDCSAPSATCVDYATCDTNRRCVAKASAGEPCDNVNGPRCLGLLLCDSGSCAFPPAAPVCR